MNATKQGRAATHWQPDTSNDTIQHACDFFPDSEETG